MEPKNVSEDVAKLAMPLLVERLGGTVEITEAELQSLADRVGGGDLRRVGVQIERTSAGLRLTIIQKEPPPLD